MPKSRNPQIEFDRLQMYFGEPFKIDFEDCRGSITLYSPTIGDVVEIGEKKFYSTLNIFCTNTTANRLMLWEAGIDWNEISDFELFSMLIKGVDPDVCKIFFHDLNLLGFERMGKTTEKGQELVLYNEEADVEINERVYFYISQYFRAMFNFYPEEKCTKDSILKKWYIDKDRRDRDYNKLKAEKGEDQSSSFLLSQISSYLNHPGTKYKLHELKEIGVCEFFDGIQRLQIYESATACMKGMYSGFVDTKHISSDDYNFMRDINKKEKNKK